jgi:hypothetical protein
MLQTDAGNQTATTLRIGRQRRWVIRSVLAALLCAVLFWLAAPNLCPPEGFRRSQCRNNLKQIGLALHSYHDAYGCLPPAFVADSNGRPMHSWRVLLLPFLENPDVYEQYRFDEPWDGPNNRQLHDTIVGVFNCPSETCSLPDRASTSTNYVAIVGPGTGWPGEASTTFSDFKDGTSLTLLVVEVANSGIHWMEPRDLHVMQMSPTVNGKSGQGISSKHTSGAHVLLADGAVRFLRDELSTDALRAMISAHAGDGPGGF